MCRKRSVSNGKKGKTRLPKTDQKRVNQNFNHFFQCVFHIIIDRTFQCRVTSVASLSVALVSRFQIISLFHFPFQRFHYMTSLFVLLLSILGRESFESTRTFGSGRSQTDRFVSNMKTIDLSKIVDCKKHANGDVKKK